MASLGSMIVNVLANTSGFESGMQRARKELTGLEAVGERVGISIWRFGKVLGAVGATVVAAKVVGQLRAVADEMDNLAKVADRLGIATESLKGFEYGAGLAGVSSESLTNALQFMTKQIGEAIHDGGKAKVVFEELGFSINTIAKMNTEQRLMLFANALSGVRSEAEKTRIAMRLFGGDGETMLNFLAEGEAGIKKYMTEAQKLGLTYSREEAAKVEEFNDAWEKLSKTIGGFQTGLTIQVSEEATKFVGDLQALVSSAEKPQRPTEGGGVMGFLHNLLRGNTAAQRWVTEDFIKAGLRPSSIFSASWSPFSEKVNDLEQAPDFDAMEKKFGLWRGQMAKTAWQPFDARTAARMDVWAHMADRQLQAIGLGKGAAYLFGRGKNAMAGLGTDASSRLQGALGAVNSGIAQAKQFGRAWQNQWLLGEFFGRRGDAAIDDLFSKRDTEAQLRGLKFLSDKLGLTRGFKDFAKAFTSPGANADQFRGVNSPLIKGTMEAARAELAHLNKRDNQAMLNENKKHTGLLTKLVEQMRVNVTGL